MNKTDLSLLIRYNFWANDRVLAVCEQLPPDAWVRELRPDPGWGSLRGILVHILDTEYGWRSALQAQDASTILEPSDFPDLAALRARWQVEREAWFDFLAALDEESINQAYGKGPPHGPNVWQTIMHVVMHGAQHRSEAAYILTGHGHSPGELDFGVFLQEAS